MGFWHTGYIDHLDDYAFDPFDRGREVELPPPVYPCPQCRSEFDTAGALENHLFDGHPTSRPVLVLRGRECGRSRLAVIEPTSPDDWAFHNCGSIMVNRTAMTVADAKALLAATSAGVVEVRLVGDRTQQDFEFSFEVAEKVELEAIDDKLADMVTGRSLTIAVIEAFLSATARYASAGRYRGGVANYLYGVLGREGSPESGLLGADDQGRPRYMARFDDAVGSLRHIERPPAEAICGLVAFQYNHFEEAQIRTRSPRVATASRRLAMLLAGGDPVLLPAVEDDRSSIDYALSDAKTEQVLEWCCIPLDASAQRAAQEMETALMNQAPADQLKIRVLLAEHYLISGRLELADPHVRTLRHNRITEPWATRFEQRAEAVQ